MHQFKCEMRFVSIDTEQCRNQHMARKSYATHVAHGTHVAGSHFVFSQILRFRLGDNHRADHLMGNGSSLAEKQVV